MATQRSNAVLIGMAWEMWTVIEDIHANGLDENAKRNINVIIRRMKHDGTTRV
jgi:hypothetical protein